MEAFLRWLCLLCFSFLFAACPPPSGPGNPVCTASTKKACTCADGKTGEQVCKADGSAWDPCNCTTIHPQDCFLGDKRACSCSDGKAGEQTCKGGGLWDACICVTCTPGAKEGCECTGGLKGSRSCNADGSSFSACSCTSSSCRENDKQNCTCPNLEVGEQVCTAGAWGACGQCGQVNNECTKAGEKKSCQCPQGGAAFRTCQADLKWSLCNCGGPACTVGEIQKTPCDCPGGYESQRRCVDSPAGAIWGPCECSCKTGETKACDCPNGDQGQRVCNCPQGGGDCVFGSCRCPTCTKDGDCTTTPGRGHCDPDFKLCVACIDDTHCAAPSARCLRPQGTCVACIEAKDCTAPEACDPSTATCKTFTPGSMSGIIRRCNDGASGTAGCSGNRLSGDNKGPLYFLFFSSPIFPPKKELKPFFVFKMDNVDYSDHTKEIPYKIEKIPPGKWIVYVFIDDNANWSPKDHLPDTGDLTGFLSDALIVGGKDGSYDIYLRDRY